MLRRGYTVKPFTCLYVPPLTLLWQHSQERGKQWRVFATVSISQGKEAQRGYFAVRRGKQPSFAPRSEHQTRLAYRFRELRGKASNFMRRAMPLYKVLLIVMDTDLVNFVGGGEGICC